MWLTWIESLALPGFFGVREERNGGKDGGREGEKVGWLNILIFESEICSHTTLASKFLTKVV